MRAAAIPFLAAPILLAAAGLALAVAFSTPGLGALAYFLLAFVLVVLALAAPSFALVLPGRERLGRAALWVATLSGVATALLAAWGALAFAIELSEQPWLDGARVLFLGAIVSGILVGSVAARRGMRLLRA